MNNKNIISILLIGLILYSFSISTATNLNDSNLNNTLLNDTINETVELTDNNSNNTLTKKLLAIYYRELDTVYVSNKGNDHNSGENWNNSVATLETGVSRVKEGGTIILDDGIYYPPYLIDIRKACTIKSQNGPTKTILKMPTKDNPLRLFGTALNTVFTIDGVGFQNFTTSYYGSALRVIKGVVNCNNCIFSNCSSEYGAAILIEDESEGTFTNCIFENCEAKNSKGGVFGNTGKLSFTNCDFMNNRAARGGGVIANYGQGKVIFVSSCFKNNRAEYGGVIYNQALESPTNNITFKSCDFINNSAWYGNIAYSDKVDNKYPASSIIFDGNYFDPDIENNFAGNIININQILTKETNNNTTNPENNTNNTKPENNTNTPIINQIIQNPYLYPHYNHTKPRYNITPNKTKEEYKNNPTTKQPYNHLPILILIATLLTSIAIYHKITKKR